MVYTELTSENPRELFALHGLEREDLRILSKALEKLIPRCHDSWRSRASVILASVSQEEKAGA